MDLSEVDFDADEPVHHLWTQPRLATGYPAEPTGLARDRRGVGRSAMILAGAAALCLVLAHFVTAAVGGTTATRSSLSEAATPAVVSLTTAEPEAFVHASKVHDDHPLSLTVGHRADGSFDAEAEVQYVLNTDVAGRMMSSIWPAEIRITDVTGTTSAGTFYCNPQARQAMLVPQVNGCDFSGQLSTGTYKITAAGLTDQPETLLDQRYDLTAVLTVP